jgi:hypothetical protein
MDTLLPTQWIAQCADRLHQRWRTVEPAQLEELAVDLWKDVQLRAMPPEKAAAVWLSPVKVQEETSTENIAAEMRSPMGNITR